MERKMPKRIPLVLLTLLSLPLQANQQVLTGATVYDGTGEPPREDASIVVEAGKITCIGARCYMDDDATVIDVSDKYITPGLIDSHVHYSASGWFDSRIPFFPSLSDFYTIEGTQSYLKDNTDVLDQTYLCSGVTAVMDTGGYSWTTSLEEPSRKNPQRPHFVAAGPLLTHNQSPISKYLLQHNVYENTHEFLGMETDEAARQSVAKVAASGASALKVWYVPVPPKMQKKLDERLQLIGREAKQQDLRFIVHAQSLREAKAALRAKADVLVHTVSDVLVDEEFINLVRNSDTVFQTTAGILNLEAMSSAELYTGSKPTFYDPNNCIDSRTKRLVSEGFEYIREEFRESMTPSQLGLRMAGSGANAMLSAINAKLAHDAGATVAVATDAGNPFIFHGPSIYMEMMLLAEAGFSPTEIIVMATLNGAKAMGKADIFGSLDLGKNADLLILSDDPGMSVKAFETVESVMRFGELHSVSSLNSEDEN